MENLNPENNTNPNLPIYNEDEYRALDPNGVAMDLYEREIKGKELGASDQLKDKIKISNDGFWGNNRGLKFISAQTLRDILELTDRKVACTLYFNGDKELTQEIIWKYFSLINNSARSADAKPREGIHCICPSAEELVTLSAACGFHELSENIAKSVMCFASPEYEQYRPVCKVQNFFDRSKNHDVGEFIKSKIKRIAEKIEKENALKNE